MTATKNLRSFLSCRPIGAGIVVPPRDNWCMDAGPVADAVALLRAAVDGLLAASLSSSSSVEVATLLSSLETERRRLEAVDQRLLAEVTERGVAGDYARTSPADLLITTLRVSPAEARARLA